MTEWERKNNGRGGGKEGAEERQRELRSRWERQKGGSETSGLERATIM